MKNLGGMLKASEKKGLLQKSDKVSTYTEHPLMDPGLNTQRMSELKNDNKPRKNGHFVRFKILN